MINTLATSNNSLQSFAHSSQTLDRKETSHYLTSLNYTKSNESDKSQVTPNEFDFVSVPNSYVLDDSFNTYVEGDISIEKAILKMKSFQCKWLKF